MCTVPASVYHSDGADVLLLPRQLCHVSLFSFSDSIRQCLGRKVKLTLKVLVKVETRGDKTENRVLVSTHYSTSWMNGLQDEYYIHAT